MIKSANIQTRIDGDIKAKAGKILSKIGLNHSEAINIYYRQIVLRRGIPFNLEIPNEATLAAFDEVKTISNNKRFSTVNELFEDLDN